MIAHAYTAIPDRYRRGWIGQYTFRHGDADKVAWVRDGHGFVWLFETAEAARDAAGEALCAALNRAQTRAAAGRTFRVDRAGGRASVKEEAERVFGGRP